MLGFLANMFMGGIGKTADSVSRAVSRFTGDKVQQAEQTHDENTAIIGQFASEFMPKAKRTWFDSLIDGINRLPRPFMALGVLGLMVWAPLDPIGFSKAMSAYALVPEWLAALFAVIVGFYFAARHLEKRLKFKGPSADQVREVIRAQREIDETVRGVTSTPEPKETTDDMTDTSKPLSDEAVEKWNNERG